MADRQSLDATFFAFRNREGAVLAPTTIAFVGVMIVLFAALLGCMWLALGRSPMELQTMAVQAETDPSALQGMMNPAALGSLALLYIAFVALFCILFAAYEAACLRWMIHGERGGGLFGLTLGADTWRVYGIYWVWLIFFIVGFVALMLVIGVLSAVLGGIFQGQPLMLLILPALAFILPIYFAVRFAPAAATSVGQKKFAFFSAWTVTRDRFWALFGSFFLLWLVYFIVVMGATGLWLGQALGPAFNEILASANDPTAMSVAINKATLDAMSTPSGMALYWGVQLVTWVVAIFFYLLLFGVNARAVQAALEEGKIKVDPV